MGRCSLAILCLAVAPLWAACEKEGCLDGGSSCEVPSPCKPLRFDCDDEFVAVRRLASGDERPQGSDALAANGDFVLENSQVVAVIDALDHPHYLAPTGGSLIDLVRRGVPHDGMNQVYQASGLLPGDAAFYEDVRILEGEGFAAIQLRGHLQDHRDQPIYTRYEVRACDPGIRVRTEAINLEPEPAVWTLADGWYWGGHSSLPLVPHRGVGFSYPDFELESATDAFRSVPYLATLPPAAGFAAYACVPCNPRSVSGFHDVSISSAGTAPRVVQPREYAIFERFIAVAETDSVAPAADIALEARRQLFGERWTELQGRVAIEAGAGGELLGETRATIRIDEGRERDAPERRTPRTQVTPDGDGNFSVRVPADRSYVVQVDAFGLPAVSAEVEVGREPADVGTLELPPAARLTLRLTLDGAQEHGLMLVQPADDETEEAVTAKRFSNFHSCAPLLGSSLGGSPACNRVLVHDPVSVAVPPGRYTVYGTMGPFVSIARQSVELQPGDDAEVALALTSLPLQPAGTLSADFHVHGAPSFDSSIPDLDRVRAFLAARLQVIAATDHDVVHDYADAIAALQADSRIRLLTGLETTGHILYDYVPGSDVPQVIGHWNFWPLERDAESPWRGAPWDELAEPGLLFTRVEEAGWPAESGIIQLNHPWATAEFGRDRGWAYALGLDTRKELPEQFDGSAQSLFRRKPEGAHYHNSDYHAQEVMNGTSGLGTYRQYRDFWFYLLDQGLVRPGTANSDSHGLADHVLGTPRTLVYSDTSFESFDAEVFNRAVREGRMLGTNGPIIEISTLDEQGQRRTPSTEAFAPAADALLTLRVSAAPWVPVDEVRIVVNGETVKTLRDELSQPADPFGLEGALRYEGEIALGELLQDVERDGWLVVEAGTALMPAGDLDCDGIVDTGDNNGDGVIDRDDVDVDADEDTPAPQTASASASCLDDTGPLRDPPKPSDREAAAYHYSAVVPEGYPAAFTNPLLFDLDGGGFTGTAR